MNIIYRIIYKCAFFAANLQERRKLVSANLHVPTNSLINSHRMKNFQRCKVAFTPGIHVSSRIQVLSSVLLKDISGYV